jgi:glutamyl-Q tRNA(Asp) synthetase
LLAWHRARAVNGRFLLRIEDIDRVRCREEFATAILDDLAWLGLDWDGEVRRQSEHFGDYGAALTRLQAMGLLYPCFCTRAEIAEAASAPHGLAGAVYPGTCRRLDADERDRRVTAGHPFALRLDMVRAAEATGSLAWTDERAGTVVADPLAHGDVVLARKEMPASYHLAVTVDDAIQGVTLVTRGEDLFRATDVQRVLQALLRLPTPRYRHHRLLTDPAGRRFAKRDKALTLAALRASGRTPAEVRRMAGEDELAETGPITGSGGLEPAPKGGVVT